MQYKITVQKTHLSYAWWCMPVIPATREAEIESSRPASATQQGPVSKKKKWLPQGSPYRVASKGWRTSFSGKGGGGP